MSANYFPEKLKFFFPWENQNCSGICTVVSWFRIPERLFWGRFDSFEFTVMAINEDMNSGRAIDILGRADKWKYCAFCEETTILTGCVDFDTIMNIRYGGICEINAWIVKNLEFLTFSWL
jgi:hypothetical protein